jgi:hypothetical protein
MTKLCPRGKAAAKRKFKVYPQHMLMLTLLKFVRVKQKIQVVLEEKILKDQNQQVKLVVVL